MPNIRLCEVTLNTLSTDLTVWSNCVVQAAAEKLGKDMVNLVGNMMLSAGVVAYLGTPSADTGPSHAHDPPC